MRKIYAIVFVLGMLGVSSGVSAFPAAIEKSVVEFTVRKGVVKVANSGNEPLEVQVYAITGVLVSKFTVEPGSEETIELPSGYYIVKAADTARRVAV